MFVGLICPARGKNKRMKLKQFDLPLTLDTLFYAVAVFFLSFAVMRYYRVTFVVAAVCALLFGAAVGILFCALVGMRRKKRALTKREREEMDALMLHLALEKPERVRALLLSAFLTDGQDARLDEDDLVCENEHVVPAFSLEPLSADAAAEILRRLGNEPFVVACKSLTPEAEKLLLSFGKSAKTCGEIYGLFMRTNGLPDPLICGNLPKRTPKMRLRATFSKQNARPFFVSGLLLLIMSLFVIFPLYYLIMGVILMITAIFVRTLGFTSR